MRWILMLLLTAAFVSAEDVIIAGEITEDDKTTVVSGATVIVSCNSEVDSTTSDTDGIYEVEFSDSTCTVGDNVTVTASKDGMVGSNTSVVKSYTTVNLAIVNVSIPEFGTITAGLALLGGAAVHYWRKRKLR